jgi:hypothetical protein
MANSATVRASLRVDVNIDSDATSATGTPVSLLCNRQYNLVDFKFNTTAIAAAGGDDGALLIESVTGGVPTTVGTVDASTNSGSTTAVLRPTTVTLTPGTTTGLSATAAVPRLSTLRVRALATVSAGLGSDIRATGTIVILPGNRYVAGGGTYYPANSAALQYP